MFLSEICFDPATTASLMLFDLWEESGLRDGEVIDSSWQQIARSTGRPRAGAFGRFSPRIRGLRDPPGVLFLTDGANILTALFRTVSSDEAGPVMRDPSYLKSLRAESRPNQRRRAFPGRCGRDESHVAASAIAVAEEDRGAVRKRRIPDNLEKKIILFGNGQTSIEVPRH